MAKELSVSEQLALFDAECEAKRAKIIEKSLQPLKDKRDKLVDELRAVEKEISALTGKPIVQKGERTRRTKEEVVQEAKAIAEWIKRDGPLSAAAIKAKYPKVGPSIVTTIKDHAGVTLKANGGPKNRTYSV